jgi:uncharacterized membrane protein
MKWKKWLAWTALFGAFALTALFLNGKVNEVYRDARSRPVRYETARTLRVIDENLRKDEYADTGREVGAQTLLVEMLSGPHKGDVKEAQNAVALYYSVKAAPGDEVVVLVSEAADGGYRLDVYCYRRAPFLFGLVGFFFLALVAIGGRKGFRSALGLVFTALCVLWLFLPMLFIGAEPVLAAILTGVASTVATLALLNGFSAKTLSAILGTALGAAVSGAVAWGAGSFARLGLFNTAEAEGLVNIAMDVPLKLNGVFFAGAIISALGAVMDVGISIASAVFEVGGANRALSARRLFASGMNVGRDMMGTMSNTLALAFAGSSVNVLILLYAYRLPARQLLNLDMLGIELLQAVSGTVGVVVTVPITAAVAACFFKKAQKSPENS